MGIIYIIQKIVIGALIVTIVKIPVITMLVEM